MEFQNGESFAVDVTPSYESPATDFTISKGVVLPANIGYNFVRYRVSGNTSSRRKVGLFSSTAFGSFYSGTRREATVGINQRLRPGLIISTAYDWNRVELKQGNFTTNIYRVNTAYQLNPRLGVANNIQYDNVSRTLGWQARFRWIAKPGNDVYIVYSRNWLDSTVPGAGLVTQNTGAATKIIYTYQF